MFSKFKAKLFNGTSSGVRNAIMMRQHIVADKQLRHKKWKDVQDLLPGRELVLFGAWAAKNEFFPIYGMNYSVSAVYDDVQVFKEICWENRRIPVYPIEKLVQQDKDNTIILVVTSMYMNEIAYDLKEMGFCHIFFYSALECARKRFMVLNPYLWFKGILHRYCQPESGKLRNFIWFHITAVLRVLHIPPFYGRVKGVKAFHNIHSGKRCFILLTGPSLTQEDVELLRNEYTIGVNGIYKMYDNTDWRPTYYCLMDHYVYRGYIKNGIELDIDDVSKEGTFLNELCRDDVSRFKKRYKKLCYIPFSYLDHTSSNRRSRHFRFTRNLVWGMYNGWTVAFNAINLAYYMGFREIYLLGADCDYTGKQHFDGSKVADAANYRGAVQSQKNLFASYEFVNRQLPKLRMKVYNATRGGALEIFPRVKLENILKSGG